MKMSCLRWDLNPRHFALQTDALTNQATKAVQLAGSKSNISYTCKLIISIKCLQTTTIQPFCKGRQTKSGFLVD